MKNSIGFFDSIDYANLRKQKLALGALGACKFLPSKWRDAAEDVVCLIDSLQDHAKAAQPEKDIFGSDLSKKKDDWNFISLSCEISLSNGQSYQEIKELTEAEVNFAIERIVPDAYTGFAEGDTNREWLGEYCYQHYIGEKEWPVIG